MSLFLMVTVCIKNVADVLCERSNCAYYLNHAYFINGTTSLSICFVCVCVGGGGGGGGGLIDHIVPVNQIVPAVLICGNDKSFLLQHQILWAVILHMHILVADWDYGYAMSVLFRKLTSSHLYFFCDNNVSSTHQNTIYVAMH